MCWRGVGDVGAHDRALHILIFGTMPSFLDIRRDLMKSGGPGRDPRQMISFSFNPGEEQG